MKSGLLLIDKQPGQTSFQMLSPVKRLYGTKKVGHAGTLDKFASGLMLVFVGQATRFVPYFTGADKCYDTVFCFGTETSTLDPEGDVVSRTKPPTPEEIIACLPQFLGPVRQQAPEFSAIHIEGKRAYQRALNGEAVTMPFREIVIHKLEMGDPVLNGETMHVPFSVCCSKGTYVRAIARDVGKASGSCAHVTQLRRIQVGSITVEQATTIDALSELTEEELGSKLLWGRELIDMLPQIHPIVVDDATAKKVSHGKHIEATDLNLSTDCEGELFAIFGSEDELLALVEASNTTRLQYRCVFPSS